MSHPLVTLVTMQQHLSFSGDASVDWTIDERTRVTGRQGIAAARATLESCSHHEISTPQLRAAA
jgi:hypothetical protein